MSDNNELVQLFKRFLNDECSEEEVVQVYDLISKDKVPQSIEDIMDDVWNKMTIYKLLETSKSESLFQSIRQNITTEPKPVQRWFSPWKMAATFLLVASVSFLVLQFTASSSSSEEPAYINLSATLGEKLTIQLEDGSKVKLNSGSSIRFPEYFTDHERTVELTGEAFFDIARDESRPFIISSGLLRTKVLGTSFNIKAFAEEDMAVTVATGKVQVTENSKPEESLFLLPGDQAHFDPVTGLLKKQQVELDDYLAWKDNVLLLRKASEKKVLESLSRWYGVTFKVEGVYTDDWDINGRFRDKPLDFILQSLGYAIGFDYELSGEQVLIKYQSKR